MAWTDEMVENLRKMWKEGLTTGEIGRRLGVSKNSIVGKVHRLQLDARPSPIKRKDTTPEAEKKNKAEKPAKMEEVSTAKKEPKKETKPETKIEVKKEEKIEVKKEVKVEVKSEVKVEPKKEKKPLAPSKEFEEKFTEKSFSTPEKQKGEKTSLVDLDNHTCRWPIGDPKDENFHFCGKKVRLGQTYCEEHSAVAYVKSTKK